MYEELHLSSASLITAGLDVQTALEVLQKL